MSDKISLETRRGETLCSKELQEAIQVSVYLCTIYGIVIIEIYSCNKELYLSHTVTLYPPLFQLTPKGKGTQR